MSRDPRLPESDRPWLMRTYAGHSSAARSNALFLDNLSRGQTGLSVAFDLPTQTGIDLDDPLAIADAGRVGVPVMHVGDMRTLFDRIDLSAANTSMTINATAMWLMALYVTVAREQGADTAALRGTTQNDILKEYLSRGTWAFAPQPSLRLTSDLIAWCTEHAPKFNPINICSYHLTEAGATPAQEVGFALANAITVVEHARDHHPVVAANLPAVVGSISFFVNAGMQFLGEIAKLRAFARLWDSTITERWGITDERARRFRYGVQVNSLGLTEAQPENNIARILIEALGVVLARDSRARAVQLPAWNEALGLPRPVDQQLSLRMQQILAFETDLLDYPDVFNGSAVMEGLTTTVADEARALCDQVLERGGSTNALSWMKSELVRSQAERLSRIESGEQIVVGVNAFTESAGDLLAAGPEDHAQIEQSDSAATQAQVDDLRAWRTTRSADEVAAALDALRRAAASTENLMDASLRCAAAGVTTGEWASVLREVFGTWDAADLITAISDNSVQPFASPSGRTDGASDPSAGRDRVAAVARSTGRPLRMVVAKPGLDGHANGAEQVAIRARNLGFEVIYTGIRATPAQIVRATVDEDADILGLSILSGAHLALSEAIVEGLAAAGATPTIVVGGIISDSDAEKLRSMGVSAVFTPGRYRLDDILADVAEIWLQRQRTPNNPN